MYALRYATVIPQWRRKSTITRRSIMMILFGLIIGVIRFVFVLESCRSLMNQSSFFYSEVLQAARRVIKIKPERATKKNNTNPFALTVATSVQKISYIASTYNVLIVGQDKAS